MHASTLPHSTHKRALLILGMHRSGTSALTRVCNLLGAALGSHLMSAAVGNNDTGFWEHIDFVNLHDRLLAALGSGWDDTRPLPDCWWEREAVQPFYEELRSLILQHFSDSSLWAIKDPRLCKLLPIWHKVLADLGIEPLHVTVVRHPINVAMSLQKRDNFDIIKSILLWLQYSLVSEHDSRNSKRVFVYYDALLANPEQVTTHIATTLDMEWPCSYDTVKEEILQFLTPSLRHHTDPSHALVADMAVRELMDETLAAIAALEKGDGTATEHALSHIQKKFETLLKIGENLHSFWYGEILHARSVVAEQTKNLADAYTLLHQRNIEFEKNREELLEKLELLTEKESDLHQRNLERTETNKKLGQLEDEKKELSAKLEEKDTIIKELGNSITTLTSTVEATSRNLAEAQHIIQNLLRSSSWKITMPFRQLKTITRFACKAALFALKPSVYKRAFATIQNYGWKKVSKKTIMVLKTQGLRGIIYYLNRDIAYDIPSYQQWIKLHDSLSEGDRNSIRQHISLFPLRPLISIVMPVYNVEAGYLRTAIDGILAQLYPDWELCIADDCSNLPHIKKILKEYAKKDKRIKVLFREENGHISACSNSALSLATGKFIALLDHDDLLPEHALYYVAYEINKHPEVDLLYSDEDKIDQHGVRYDPYFKPDWNPDLFYGQNMFSHLGVYRHSLLKKIGGFRKDYEGSQDYDLCLRCLKETTDDKIRHIPHILYHWRAIPGSTALSMDSKDYASVASRKALVDFFSSYNPHVILEDAASGGGYHRIHWPLPTPAPKVTLIIPTRNGLKLLSKCVESILAVTDYPNYDILIVNNQSDDPETLAYLEHLSATQEKIRVLDYNAPFNYSAINNFAVLHTDSPLIGLINNDIEAIHSDWLTELASHAIRKEIGATGAKLYYPNNTVQHGGVVTGTGAATSAVATHLFHGLPRHSPGYFGRAQLTQSLTAVTAACLILRRDVFDEVGRLEEKHLAVAFNDVDLCLRIRQKGYRIIWTPYAELYHHESATRGYEDTPEKFARFQKEVAYMRSHWGEILDNDPYYNPNLDLQRGDFSLAFPPRVAKPWLMHAEK